MSFRIEAQSPRSQPSHPLSGLGLLNLASIDGEITSTSSASCNAHVSALANRSVTLSSAECEKNPSVAGVGRMLVKKEEGCLSDGVALSVAGSRRIHLLRRANFPRYQHHRVYTIYPHPSSRVFIRSRQLNSKQEKDGGRTEERGGEDRTVGVGDEDPSISTCLFSYSSSASPYSMLSTVLKIQLNVKIVILLALNQETEALWCKFRSAQRYLPTRLYVGIVSFSTFEFVAFRISVLGNKPFFINLI
ncbi:hypothetical protein BT96DRAFT_482305 [Gymnopus androsaceus JB14]|uniref:Uncharacterized protein n=1 Tax=Gymnopus androsaceus JB14 TaxID=1447944 RepID=A0A6A4I4E2_9AGAR|nr:hypothetical protein BT96DRAFT_482305 [Gymnopus androsaceus JB14]